MSHRCHFKRKCFLFNCKKICLAQISVITHKVNNHDSSCFVDSNPAGCWLFFLLYPLSSESFIQVPQGKATLLIFLFKLCLAVQLEAKQALYGWIEQKMKPKIIIVKSNAKSWAKCQPSKSRKSWGFGKMIVQSVRFGSSCWRRNFCSNKVSSNEVSFNLYD